jgi:hypothetical protein
VSTTIEPSVAPAVCQRLSERFAEAFTTFVAAEDAFAPDAFFDLNMPVWRFQLQGATAFAAQLRSINHGPSRVDVLRTVPAVGGFLTEHEEHQLVEGEDFMARRLWWCAVEGDRITEAVGFCTGEWDAALRARHAAEAPMLRPWPALQAAPGVPGEVANGEHRS